MNKTIIVILQKMFILTVKMNSIWSKEKIHFEKNINLMLFKFRFILDIYINKLFQKYMKLVYYLLLFLQFTFLNSGHIYTNDPSMLY